MVTAVWLSSAVENTWLFLVGIDVLRSIRRVNTPPKVSMPSESGVTSNSSTSFTSPFSTPAWMAAPSATTSTGLTERFGSLPKKFFTVSKTLGMRVMPPTRMTSWISDALRPASFNAARHDRLLDQIVDQRFELGARQLDVEMLRAGLVGRDGLQIDLGLHRGAELDLRLLRRLFQALEGQPVAAQIDALLFFELVGEIIDDALVEILAAQEGVAVGGLDLEDAVADLEHGHVEGAAAEVIDRDDAVLLLLEPIGERGRGRLVDDAQHVEAGDPAGILGRLALAVVEIGWNGDDGLGDRLAEIGLGGFLHLLQDEGADLGGSVFLAAAFDPGVAVVARHDLEGDELHLLLDHRVDHAPADQALDAVKGVLGVGDRLALGGLAAEALAGLGEGDLGRRRARALAVFDDLRGLAFHHGNAGIRRAEIDADNLRHSLSLLAAGSFGPETAPRQPPGNGFVVKPGFIYGRAAGPARQSGCPDAPVHGLGYGGVQARPQGQMPSEMPVLRGFCAS